MPFKQQKDRTAYTRKWRLEHPDADRAHRTNATRRQTIKRNSGDVNACTALARARKAALIAYLGGACKDCGGVFPACCYDFDHLRDKCFEIGHSMLTSFEKLKAEAEKCDLVCANCHRIRTQKRATGA